MMHHGVRSMLASKALLADDDTLIVARLGLSVIPSGEGRVALSGRASSAWDILV